jgi:hypothetical protein
MIISIRDHLDHLTSLFLMGHLAYCAGMNTQNPHLDALGHAIALDGFGPHEAEVASIVELGFNAGLSRVLLGVVADPAEPEVARTRALGRVLVALGRSRAADVPRRSDLEAVA